MNIFIDRFNTSWLPQLKEFRLLRKMARKNEYDGEYVYMVADAANRIIGLAIVFIITPGVECKIHCIEILPEYRHQGIGRKMVAYISRIHGAVIVHSLPESAKFYESIGFEPTGNELEYRLYEPLCT